MMPVKRVIPVVLEIEVCCLLRCLGNSHSVLFQVKNRPEIMRSVATVVLITWCLSVCHYGNLFYIYCVKAFPRVLLVKKLAYKNDYA